MKHLNQGEKQSNQLANSVFVDGTATGSTLALCQFLAGNMKRGKKSASAQLLEHAQLSGRIRYIYIDLFCGY